MNVCTVILGAGKGSRMKSITPKPFHKIANLKLIDWVLNTHNSIKIDKKIIVTSKNINYSEYSKTNRIVIQNDQFPKIIKMRKCEKGSHVTKRSKFDL